MALRASDSKSVSMVEKLHGAIAHEHKLRFLAPPTEHASIKLLMKSVRRHYTKPSQSVEPLNLEHLEQINRYVIKLSLGDDLQIWRTAWRMNIQFYTLCRFSEINCLTTEDIEIFDVPKLKIVVQIRKSKTDQSGKGATKTLYAVEKSPLLCPVSLTKRYLTRLSKSLPNGQQYKGFLQPQVQKSAKLGYQIALKNKQICYSTCLEESKKLLAMIGAKGRFGEHSGRRGGATTAAANGAKLEEVQQLGGWKSANCASRYIDQNEAQKEKLNKLIHPK